VPMLWAEEDGRMTRISTPSVVREVTAAMDRMVARPMLLLSAAVGFEQYAAQYGIVSDIVAGPMCGRAYFKEAFADPGTTSWDTLSDSFRRIALPRIRQIRGICRILSRPWWCKFSAMSEDAKALIQVDAKPKGAGVDADGGY
jgi:hypothetical protein